MNTAVRTQAQNRLPQLPTSTFALIGSKKLNLIILVMLFFSAFSVIYLKDFNRRLFIEFQALQATHDKLYEDWEKLLLEQSTWSTQARVKKIAIERLGMSMASPKEVTVWRVGS